MKKRIEELLTVYRQMARQTRSKIRREVLENVIADLEVALAEAQ